MKASFFTTTGIKALCLIIGMGAAGLPALAAPKAETEKVSTAVKSPQEKVGQLAGDEETVSINSATAEQLAAALNGVGLKKGQAIVSYREQNGPFTQVDQLQEVPGIGKSLLERNQSRLKL